MKRTFAVVLTVAMLAGVAGCAPSQRGTRDTSPEAMTSTSSATSTSAARLAVSPWPMGGHDAQRTGRSDFSGPASPTVKWEFGTKERVHTSPVIAVDGTIYIATEARLYAVNPDGTKKWEFKTKGDPLPFSGIALGADGTVYAGGHDEKLHAINPDGTEKWESRGPLGVPVVGQDGTIYAGDFEDGFFAVNPDGTKKWRIRVKADGPATAAIGRNGVIYLGMWDGHLFAINPDGTPRWEFFAGGSASARPAVADDGTVYFNVADQGHGLYAINPDGTKKWEYPVNMVDGRAAEVAIGRDGTIYVGSGGRHWKLCALNPDGTERWALGQTLLSAATIGRDGTVYLSTAGVFAVSPQGARGWEIGKFDPLAFRGGRGEILTGSLWPSPAIGRDGSMYVSTPWGLQAIGEAK